MERRLQRTLVVLATMISALCVASLFAWSANDASFSMAVWVAHVELGIENFEMDAGPLLTWDPLGRRVLAILFLYAAGVSSAVLLVVSTLRSARLVHVLSCILVLAAWGTFLATRDAVDHWRMIHQVAAILPQFRLAATELTQEWPEEAGKVPPGIRFDVGLSRHPDVLLVRDVADYPTEESIGLMITRGQNGIIRFDLAGAYDSEVEYHPNGTEPSPYISGLGYPSPPVKWVHRFDDDWFLVRYGP